MASSGDQFLNRLYGSIPGSFTISRVIHMPAKTIDTTTGIHLLHQFLLQFEGNAIDIMDTVVLNLRQIPTVHRGVIAGYTFNVRPISIELPAYAISQIIVMTEHDSCSN